MIYNSYPKRGEVWIVALDKDRPAIIIQNNKLTSMLYGTGRKEVVIIPIRGQKQDHWEKWKNYPSVIELKKDEMNHLNEDSFIITHQITTVLDIVFIRHIGHLTAEKLLAVESKLNETLGLLAT